MTTSPAGPGGLGGPRAAGAKIRVLVVDDSAFARKVLRELLTPAQDIEIVAIARDGLEALEKIAELTPDVVTLDLMMPELDGVGVLRTLAEQRERGASVGKPAHMPRVLVVSLSDRESELGVAALELGAIDVVAKPTALATDRLYEMGGELLAKVRAAYVARAPAPLHVASPSSSSLSSRSSSISHSNAPSITSTIASTIAPPFARSPSASSRSRLVVIGTSTGGPQALHRLLASTPAHFSSPIAIALHIPAGYTDTLATRLNDASPLRVVEARTHLVLEPGSAVLARGGMHLKVRALDAVGLPEVAARDARETSEARETRAAREANEVRRYAALVDVEPATAMHFPSVDVLFRSAARAAGPDTIGVVLTGMGDDGVEGARAIVDAGGIVITEAESSCVVFGMPRAVQEAGLSSAQAPLHEMAALLSSLV